MPKKQTTAAKVTAEFDQHLDYLVLIITVRRSIHKQNIYVRAAIPKTLVRMSNHNLARKYRKMLADQVHPMIQTLFPAGDGILQDNNAPIHALRLVLSWFDEQEDEVKHLPWSA
ncbi:DDE_3 domain-containing protein [Trichonephila clavipes]|nr:DDE_3 domain-containing protein [Trichonephila clavipes]